MLSVHGGGCGGEYRIMNELMIAREDILRLGRAKEEQACMEAALKQEHNFYYPAHGVVVCVQDRGGYAIPMVRGGAFSGVFALLIYRS